MKKANKFLALLLSLFLALALSLGVSAVERDQTEKILIDGEEATVICPADQTVPFGADVMLAVEANLPEGVEITYQWKYENATTAKNEIVIEQATESVLRCSPGDAYYPTIYPSDNLIGNSSKPYVPAKGFYFCSATLIKKDAGNVVDTQTIDFSYVCVTVEAERDMNLGEKFLASLYLGLGVATSIGILTMGMGFVFFPVTFPAMFLLYFFS